MWRLCLLLLLVSAQEDTDGESSRKVLGSSVVTSVSVIMDTGNGTKFFTDAVGKPVSKPEVASDIASPIDLLNPDRYEFYTFDDAGDLVKRLMTLEEIQEIIATGDGGDPYMVDDDLDATKTNFLPEKRVNDVVNNVQNVLKGEIQTHQSVEKPLYDTPDVSDHWSMILPAVFGNSGEDIKPEQATHTHVTPDTIMIEPQPMINVQIISHSNSTPIGSSDSNDTSQIYEIQPIKNQQVTTYRPIRTTDKGPSVASVRTTPHGFVLTTSIPATYTSAVTTSTSKPTVTTSKPVTSTRSTDDFTRIASTTAPTTGTPAAITSTTTKAEPTTNDQTPAESITNNQQPTKPTAAATTLSQFSETAITSTATATTSAQTPAATAYAKISLATRRTTLPTTTVRRTTAPATTTDRLETTTDQLTSTTDESTLATLIQLLKEGNLPTTTQEASTTETSSTETSTVEMTTTPQPLSTFFIISDNNRETTATAAGTTNKYLEDLSTLGTEYVTKYTAAENTDRTTTQLDQFLLTSTNIYEINSVLSEKGSTLPDFDGTTDFKTDYTTESTSTVTFADKFNDFKEVPEIYNANTRLENTTNLYYSANQTEISSTSVADELQTPQMLITTERTSVSSTQLPLGTPQVIDEVLKTVSSAKPPESTQVTIQSVQNFDEKYSKTKQQDTATVASKLVDSTAAVPHIINITIIQKGTTDPITTTAIESTESTSTILPSTESSTATPAADTKWLLISTLAPPPQPPLPESTTIYEAETKTPFTEPTPQVDLVPKPLQGFGLEDSTAQLDTDIYQFVQLCNELAFGFWKSVTTGLSTARSIVVSPFAATSLLAMVFLGARGATSGEMNEILKLDDMVTFNPHLIFKNVSESILGEGVAVSALVRELYSDRSKGKLLSFYKERVRQFYDGHVEEASFKEIGDVIRRRTNLLVKKETGGKIQEFLRDGSILPRAPLAGVSVSIFQTDCSQGSVDGRDGEIHFIVSPSIRQRRLVPIPAILYRTNFLAGYEPSLDATAAALGTKDHTVTTIFIMPGQQGNSAPGDGLLRLEKHLIESGFRKGAWPRLLRSLIPRPGLELQIPRFQHRSLVNATQTLRKMGLHDLFDSRKADLKGLNGAAHDFHLSDVLQINEFATCGEGRISDTHHKEIYPATVSLRRRRVLIRSDSIDYRRAFHDPLHDPTFYDLPLSLRPRQARVPEVPRLRFDRPFLYFVRHNPTGLILHMGRFHPRLLP